MASIRLQLVSPDEFTGTARRLRIAGFAIMSVYASFVGLMLIGNSMTDPGGVDGLLIVLATAAAIAAAAAADRRWPRVGLVLLVLLGVAGVGFHLAIGLGLLEDELLQGQDVPAWALMLAFAILAFFCLAAWHAWRRLKEGAVLMLGFGLALILEPVPGLVLAAPAIVAAVLLRAADQIRQARAAPA